jgi:mono/diheme cytochrome c family protein
LKPRALPLVACLWTASIGIALTDAAAPQGAPASSAAPANAQPRRALDTYCVTCHNERAKMGGLALDSDLSRVAEHAAVWERVVRKLRTHTMPPQGMPRPDEATYRAVASWLETELDRAASRAPDPGRPLLQRLNRAEYANVVRDLLDVEVNVRTLLPADDSAFGFDNNADLLTVSSTLLERYLTAADRVSALAIGDPKTPPGSETYHVRGDQSQGQHLEGLPFGTVGGLAVRHTFPLDGEYQFQLTLFRTNLEAIRGLEHPHQIEISVDGERVFLTTVGGSAEDGRPGTTITERSDATDRRLQVRIPVKAGPRLVAATFVRKIGANTNRLRPFLRSNSGTYDSTGRPHIETLTVTGPFNATGPGDTPSRRRIFTCKPSRPSAETACARQILSSLARRAYRRPVGSADLEPLLAFYAEGRKKGTFETGVQLALRRLLASPSFVFRVEENPSRATPGTSYRVSDVELASRLSFFLWSSMPDDPLLDVAAEGRLRAPGVLEAQVRRMLADPKSKALVENFAGQWLHVRNLQNIAPNSDEFPDFDHDLRDAFRQEIELFFASIVGEDRSALDLMTADYTFVNERLAKHYGLPYIYGSHFRRVTLPDGARRGLLGKGAVLLATSHADRTAPVLRGKWIMENLLGTPPPAPPANVPPLEPQTGAKPKTMRERMDVHRANPACAGCHRPMDSLGFAMENFNAVGAWRAREAGAPIDASGTVTDGTAVTGVVELREALMRRPELFAGTLTEKLLIYALGRGLRPVDMPAVRGIVRDSSSRDYRFSSIIQGIVSSVPFQMRRAS